MLGYFDKCKVIRPTLHNNQLRLLADRMPLEILLTSGTLFSGFHSRGYAGVQKQHSLNPIPDDRRAQTLFQAAHDR